MGSETQSPVYRLGKLKGQFVVVWRERGRRRRFRLRAATTIEARAELIAFAKARARAAEKETSTVTAIFQAYLRDREIDGKSIEKQRHSWKALVPYFGALAPSHIDKALCRDFQKDRLKAGRAVGTVWTDLSVLRAAVNWARKSDLIPKAPFIWLPPQPKPRDRHLTRTEFERLLAECKTPHLRLFVLLAIHTAARAGAILDLAWDRVDFKNAQVDMRTPEANKHKRRVVVPMNATLLTALRESHPNAMTPFVVEWAGRRVRKIKGAFERAVARAGFGTDVTPNTLRHTAAVWMAEAGVPMAVIAQYLGHADSRTTERVYARFSPNYLKTAADALELPPVRSIK